MRHDTILFLGDFCGENALHAATRNAALHAAQAARVVLNTRWMGAADLALYPGMVDESAGVVLAPPRDGLPGAGIEPLLMALRTVRESGIPFLATGSSHGLVFVEAARTLLGLEGAERDGDSVLAALPSLDGDSREIDPELALDGTPLERLFEGHDSGIERTDSKFGLDPDHARRIEGTGFRTVARDRRDGRPCLHVLEGHPYHVTAGYLPQFGSSPEAPHPLFRGLVAACLDAR